MSDFALAYTAEARLKIRHLHPDIKQEIRRTIEILKAEPWLGKRLTRELAGLYSLRIKNYRVIYSIHEDKKEIRILTLGRRKTIYEDIKR